MLRSRSALAVSLLTLLAAVLAVAFVKGTAFGAEPAPSRSQATVAERYAAVDTSTPTATASQTATPTRTATTTATVTPTATATPVLQDVAVEGILDARIAGSFVLAERDLAYVLNSSELRVFSLAEQPRPKEIATLTVPSDMRPSGVAAAGTRAYLSGSFGSTSNTTGLPDAYVVVVIDVADPLNPRTLGRYTTSSYMTGFAVSERYIYTVEYSFSERRSRLVVVDAADGANLVSIGGIDVNNGGSGAFRVYGSTGYLIDTSTGVGNPVFQVVSLVDPRQPSIVGSTNILIGNSLNLGSVSVAKNHAYVTVYCHPVHCRTSGSSSIAIVDVTEPTQPQAVGSFGTASFFSGFEAVGSYGYHVIDDYYGNHVSTKLRILSLQNSLTPVEVGSYTTPGTFFLGGVACGLVYLPGEAVVRYSGQATPVTVPTPSAWRVWIPKVRSNC